MLNLIFLLSLIVTPFLSVVLGILLFSGLPIGVGVGLTILRFLILFFGSQYFASRWLTNIRAPAKTIKFEATLLSSPDKVESTPCSPSSDTSKTSEMTELDVPYVFGLGVIGHITCVIGTIIALSTVSRGEPTAIIACRGFVAVMLIWAFVRNSKASPFFAPPLIASLDGIRSQKYFVPWRDVVNVFVGSDRGHPLYVEAAKAEKQLHCSFKIGMCRDGIGLEEELAWGGDTRGCGQAYCKGTTS
jgi:hypothetical protein